MEYSTECLSHKHIAKVVLCKFPAIVEYPTEPQHSESVHYRTGTLSCCPAPAVTHTSNRLLPTVYICLLLDALLSVVHLWKSLLPLFVSNLRPVALFLFLWVIYKDKRRKRKLSPFLCVCGFSDGWGSFARTKNTWYIAAMRLSFADVVQDRVITLCHQCAQIQELYYRKFPYIRFVLLSVPICL